MHWPIRTKTVSLLLLASVAPLCVSAWLDIRESRERLITATSDLLAARADHLADQLDVFHRRYQNLARIASELPAVRGLFQPGSVAVESTKSRVHEALKAWPEHDPNIRGVGVIGKDGTVVAATESPLIGVNVSKRSHIQESLKARQVISNIFVAQPEVGNQPTIAYLSPVFVKGKTEGIAVIWVRASALWSVMKKSNELAGSKSYAVLFDQQGIRIGHTYSDEILFHPGGRLDPQLIDALVAEGRFGAKTRELLEDVREFPEQFARARSGNPDLGMFRGFAPVNQLWNFGVARRFETVPWTIFYMVPEDHTLARVSAVTK